MERMLENAHEKFVTPLEAFRKEQIGSVKKTKKDFEVSFTNRPPFRQKYRGGLKGGHSVA